MRIVQIIDILYYGGAQTMQVMFARSVREFPDINLTVVSLRDNTHNTPIPDQLKALGVEVKFCSAQKLWNIKRFWNLVAFLRQGNFDVIHTHLPYANILGTLAGRFAGIPVIASLRNSKDDDWGRYYSIRNWLETILLRYFAEKVMAVGFSTASAHQKRLGRQKIEAVPNALEIIPPMADQERNQIRMELVGDTDAPLVISVGRLVPQKGYADLILAFANVVQGHPKARLLIVGDGPLYDLLARKIKELGLRENVKLLGSRNDVPRLLAASDLFVNSSHWEGLSVAILEAMAAGLPIVATNVSDTPRLVVDNVGMVVPPQSSTALAEAISFFLRESALRKTYGAAARDFIARNHSPEAWAKKIISLYESI
jgi:glycosyltransferase involved in cell wall biosynthesis